MTFEPVADLDPAFSSPDAQPTPWAAARELLDSAKTYWISTVRPDGRPHVATIAAVWLDDAIHFVTGTAERKARNLASNDQVVVTTGCNGWDGLDVAIEGRAVPVTDLDRKRRLVDAFTAKYDDFFGFRILDGEIHNPGSTDPGLVFEVVPTKGFAFAKGDSFSQTRWKFD
jgi:nitroimidazol reductase NimA-like FMN-containing flavoprotein (pyridoxamine 5'-phosphate oxidase superfamily)